MEPALRRQVLIADRSGPARGNRTARTHIGARADALGRSSVPVVGPRRFCVAGDAA